MNIILLLEKIGGVVIGTVMIEKYKNSNLMVNKSI